MKYCLALILLSLLTTQASAQITITEQEYLSALASAGNGASFLSHDITGLQTLVNSAGPNQTWDFGTRVWTKAADSSTSTFSSDPSAAPLSSNFPGATHVLKILPAAGSVDQATLYDFMEINASGVWTLGFSQDSLGMQSVLETFTPPEQMLAFPLTYGTTWSSASSINSPKVPSGFTDSTAMTTTIDGYGTLITPAAPTGVNALREKQETIAKESYGTLFSLETRAYNFSWLTLGFDQAGITADSNEKPVDATYSAGSASGVRASNGSSDPLSISLSQNPASNTETKLYYSLQSATPVQVEIMDAIGKNIRQLQNGMGHAGENIIPIDPATLSMGTYFIRVETGGMSAMQKLIIQ